MKDVFISYSSKDFDKVHTIKSVLEKNGISCWMAPQSIPTGSSYMKEIPTGINNCKVFLLMISNQSQKSEWVPKEISIAITKRKTILPFFIENCELTDSFDFVLTDIQRYNAWENSSEILNEMVRKIKYECGIKSEEISACSENNSTSNYTVQWIISKEPKFINKNLSLILKKIKRQYKEISNAKLFNDWYVLQKIDDIKIDDLLQNLYDLKLYMDNAADIDVKVALIYIHSGESNYIKNARYRLERAVNIYLSSNNFDEEHFKKVIYIKWLTAVTYKQERNFGIALDLCKDLTDYINTENQYFECEYSETLLLPEREILVIQKEEPLCDYLLTQTKELQYNVTELFFTQRRLFELYILRHNLTKAKEILPDLLTSFDKCKLHIDSIYEVGLYQNLFEYYMYSGDRETADEYYQKAFIAAKKNFWEGKKRKLETLKTIYG